MLAFAGPTMLEGDLPPACCTSTLLPPPLALPGEEVAGVPVDDEETCTSHDLPC